MASTKHVVRVNGFEFECSNLTERTKLIREFEGDLDLAVDSWREEERMVSYGRDYDYDPTAEEVRWAVHY